MSKALYTDGAEALYDYAQSHGDTPEARSARELVVVRRGQRVSTKWSSPTCDAWSSRLMINGLS